MEFLLIWVLPVIGGIIWYLISNAAVKAPGNILNARFAELTRDTSGVIAGKTLAEVKAKCGNPSSVAALGDGNTLYQWQATGYHIALIFDENDICAGISSETKV